LSHGQLVTKATALISSTAAEYRALEGTYAARSVIPVMLKLDKPRRWWHLGRSRRLIATSGIQIKDSATSVIMYDGSLVRGHWEEEISKYNGVVTCTMEYYKDAALASYSRAELVNIIERLTPV